MSDPAELEREAEAARARLSETADQIRARMSPGQIMDEVLTQFRGSDGSQMLANLRGQVRDNPMALALVGSGLAWLMMGSGPSQGQGPWRYPSAPARSPAHGETDTGNFASYRLDEDSRTGAGGHESPGAMSSAVGSASSAVGSAASSVAAAGSSVTDTVRDSVSGMARGASDALSSARSAVGEGLHEAGERAHRMAHDLRSTGSDAFGGARHSAAGMGSQARDTFFDVLDREPLVIGAIGLAVGAAIGAFLPPTEIEREHLGPTGEALKEKASDLVGEGMAKAREAATEVYETAREEADRQGLLPGDKPIAEKVDAVVRAVGETAGEIVEKNAPGSTGTDTGTGSGTSSGGGSHSGAAGGSGTTGGTSGSTAAGADKMATRSPGSGSDPKQPGRG